MSRSEFDFHPPKRPPIAPAGACVHSYAYPYIVCPYGCHDAQERAKRQRQDAELARAVASAPKTTEANEDETQKRNTLIDMTGETKGEWLVLKRVASKHGSARWSCRHVAINGRGKECGAIAEIDGIVLRRKPPKSCAVCRPYRRGRKLGARAA